MQTLGERLGAGLGYRAELARDIARHLGEIDYLEVFTEELTSGSPDRLARLMELCADKQVTLHGTALSLGTDMPVDEAYLSGLDGVVRELDPPWFSDHLSFCRVPDVDVGQLLPLWFTEESLELVRRNVKAVKQRVKRPFLLENISYYFHLPRGQMTEAEFLSRALRETDSGLLLDLNSVHLNSLNIGFDPYDFLRQIPLERVVEIHLAGGRQVFGMVVDNHGARVHDEVWLLLEHVVRHADVHGVVLEWDQDFPPFQVLLDHLKHARNILRRAGAGRCRAH